MTAFYRVHFKYTATGSCDIQAESEVSARALLTESHEGVWQAVQGDSEPVVEVTDVELVDEK